MIDRELRIFLRIFAAELGQTLLFDQELLWLLLLHL